MRRGRYGARMVVQLLIVLLLLGGMALFLIGAFSETTGWMVLGALAMALGWALTGLAVTLLRDFMLARRSTLSEPAIARRGRGMFLFGALFFLLAVIIFALDVAD